MKAVSVIVCIYNVEKWIKRCLDSLVNQTLANIEIICVDDGSPDNCGKICDEYAARDKRIQVIRQKNGGLASARNTGLKAATGEYVGFVDPDDCVDIGFFEKLYSKAAQTGAEIVRGQKYQITINKLMPKWIEPLYKSIGKIPIFSANKRIKKNRGHFNFGCWSAIYKRDFIVKNGIDFPVGIITGQEALFLTKTVCLVNKMEFVNGAYYNYFRRPDSLDSKILNKAKVESKISAANLVIDFINSIDIDSGVYGVIFKKRVQILLKKTFSRSPDADMRLALAQSAVDLYKKCKYPKNCKAGKYFKFLSNGDAAGLHGYLEKKYF